MPPDELVAVRHALDAARKALSLAQSRARADLDKDELLALAMVRLLELVGEAATNVSGDFRQKHAEIPWKKMERLRHRLVHAYDLNLDMVWATARTDLPPLIMGLKKLAP